MAHYITDKDGNLIKVAGNSKTSHNDQYSTTEQLTGKCWIDGKPIYRKVIETSIDFSSVGAKTISAGVAIDNLVDLRYSLVNGDTLQTHNSAITAVGYVKGLISLYCNVAWKVIPITFIIEYTKS